MLIGIRKLVLCLPLCWLVGCASQDLRGYRTAHTAMGPAPLTVAEIPVRSGQIIVSDHPSGSSLAVSLIAERFARYTHVGLVVIDEGEPFVYESMGTFLPVPWRPPNARMGGGVQRVSLATFVARGGIVAIYDPPPAVDPGELVAFARARLRERRGFDGRYDPRDGATFYCVEFVVRALEAAGSPPIVPARATRNPSMQVALRWLDIRTPEFLLAGDLLVESRRSVLLSKELEPALVERYFAIKEELHRRFTVDQKLGHLFTWKGQSLKLRPVVDRFTDEAMRSAEEPRVLADRLLGPAGPGSQVAVVESTRTD